jgi:thiamine biosynthesis lipoprotein
MTGLGTDGLVSYAGPGDWQQVQHVEPVWGTHVVLDLRGPSLPADVDAIVTDAVAFLHQVDAWFSTYRADTPITMYRNGLIDSSRLPQVVRTVLDACAGAKQLTEGWAAGVVADQIVARGVPNVCVNASGDIACRGYQSAGSLWSVGITNPYDTQSVIRAVSVPDGWAIATSGLYERGSHIANTVTGDVGVYYDSATVVGPDAGLADALATACLVEGPDCTRWFVGLHDWSVYLVKDAQAQFFGPAFT